MSNDTSETTDTNTWNVQVKITLKEGILDPEGSAVEDALQALGYENVSDMHVGKFMTFRLESQTEEQVNEQIEEMCERLLANPVIEDYNYEITRKE